MSNLHFTSTQYPSTAFFIIKQLGLVPGVEEPVYQELGNQMSILGENLSFSSPIIGGPVFTLIYQLPSYLGVTPMEFDDLFKAISFFVEKEDLKSFFKKWPEKTKYWEQWFNDGWMNLLFTDLRHDKTRALAIIETFLLLLHDNWLDYSRIYQERLSNIKLDKHEDFCKSFNIFKRWEQDFNHAYPYDNFTVVVCPETIITSNNLGPEKIVLGIDKTKNSLNTCVHEIGVRMIDISTFSKHQDIRNLIIGDYKGVTQLIEAEICYRKQTVFPEIRIDSFAEKLNLHDLIAWRATKKGHQDFVNSFTSWYQEAKGLSLI